MVGMKAVLVVVTPAILLACSEYDTADAVAEFRSRPHIQASAERMECANLVDRFVASTKHWADADYKVAFENVEGDVTVFRVSHVDDYSRDEPYLGGGTSILVEADCGSGRVLRELGMQ